MNRGRGTMQIQQTDDGKAQKQLGVALVFSQTSEIYGVGKEGWRMEREDERKEKGRLLKKVGL